MILHVRFCLLSASDDSLHTGDRVRTLPRKFCCASGGGQRLYDISVSLLIDWVPKLRFPSAF